MFRFKVEMDKRAQLVVERFEPLERLERSVAVERLERAAVFSERSDGTTETIGTALS